MELHLQMEKTHEENGKLSAMKAARRDSGTLCGIGSCKPAFVQIFARIGAFVGVYSIAGFLTSTLTIYINSQVPMLEKQFGFSSAETGLLMSFNDIGYLSCVIFAGYIARKVHIPRGLAISTTLFGISGILCAVPYFMQDKSIYDLGLSSLTNETRSDSRKPVPICLMLNTSDAFSNNNCLNKDSAETSHDLEKLWIKKAAFALIAIGFVFQGIAKSPRHSFVTLYIDDAVEKKKTGFYMGILYGVGVLGPVIAYLLGGFFSKIYVTLEAVDITPGDPRWIGAWWLGFLLFGASAIIFCIPLICFPKKLRSKKRSAGRDEVLTPKIVDKSKAAPTHIVTEATQMLFAYGRVLSNPVYTVVTISSCFHAIGFAGVLAFMPKYMASQYSVPVWKANIIMALSGILAASLGSFIGGLLTRKFNMTPKMTFKLLIFFLGANIIVSAIGLFVGCDQPVLLGDNGQDSDVRRSSLFYDKTNTACRGDCECNNEKYFPICGDDGISYYSPCHAGCTTQNKMSFSNCTCIPSGNAVPGLCDQGCSTRLYIYAVLNFLGGLFGAGTFVPTLMAKLRCVDERDRAVSTALSGFLLSASGWMPGPVIFGRIIDGSCLLWKYTCGERLSCQLYDIVYFRVAIHVYGLVCKGIGLLLVVGLYIYVRVTNKKEWHQSEMAATEIPVNGGDTTVSTSLAKQLNTNERNQH